MHKQNTATQADRYEVEIQREPHGLLNGVVYRIDAAGDRHRVGETHSEFGGGTATSRDTVLKIARRIARDDRDATEVVKLDLDAQDE